MTTLTLTDVDSNKIDGQLNKLKSHLEDGFKVFSSSLTGLNQNLCSKVNLDLAELISGAQSFLKGKDLEISC